MSAIKEFFLKVASDDALMDEFNALNASVDKAHLDEAGQRAFAEKQVVPFAKKLGFDLDVEDFFSTEEEEMSEEDLKAVAGGGACYCVLGGGGTYDSYYSPSRGGEFVSKEDLTCACVAGGGGQYRVNGSTSERCCCVAYGEGKGYDPDHGDFK